MPHWVSKGCKSLVYGWFSALGGRLVLKWRQCLNNPLFHLATIFMLLSQLNHNKMSKKDLSLCGRRRKVHPIKEFSCATFQHELKHYSQIVAEGKTFVLVFWVLYIESTQLFTRRKRLRQKFCPLQRSVNSSLTKTTWKLPKRVQYLDPALTLKMIPKFWGSVIW